MRSDLTVWIFQTGEPIHIDKNSPRPMRAMNLANMLIERGHNVILWSSSFYHQEKTHRSKIFKTITISNSLEIRLIPSPGYNGNISLGRLWDHAILAKNLKHQLTKVTTLPDIAFVGYPPIEAATVLNRFLKKNKVPSILDIKDQWPNIFLKIFPQSLQFVGKVFFSPYFYLAKCAMRDATNLSAMANGFLQWATDFSGRPKDSNNMVIPLTTPNKPIADSALLEARLWWDNKGILNDGTPYLYFVGSHSPAFDFKTVFDAAKKFETSDVNCHFVICGKGELTSNFIKMTENLSNVHFPGWVNQAQANVLASRSIASLAPYGNTEDFMMSIPNKVIDSLSLGLPILSPLKGEVKALIKTYHVGYSYKEHDSNSLYEDIKRLMLRDEERKKMSENSLKIYQDQFSYEIVYGDLVKHMEQMVFESKQ